MPLGPDTVGRKLLWSIGLPGLLVALLGVGHFWRESRVAVQDATQVESLALAEFVASTFSLPQAPRARAHEAVAEVLQSDTRLFRSVEDVRVLTPDGRIRWSRQPDE
ncbi:diguanylate cyclase, partial [Pyxidicoccus sp. 3LFB2]